MQHSVRKWREALGLSLSQVAARCASKPAKATISKLETGIQKMTLAWLSEIAAALDVPDPQMLLKDPPPDLTPINKPRKNVGVKGVLTPSVIPNVGGRQEAHLPAGENSPRDVPVFGVIIVGDDGYFIINIGAGPVDYARRGAGIMHSRTVFAFYVVNTSMEPRYDPGDVVYCDPMRPVRVGDDVVVEMIPKADDEQPVCLLKRLVRRAGSRVILKQFNPEQEIEMPMASVARLIHVLTRNEVAGN